MMKFFSCFVDGEDRFPFPAAGAHSFLDRLRGFMFQAPPRHALWLLPCASVHTLGMRFSLHILFLDAEGTVLRSVPDVPAGRMFAMKGSRSVLEIPADALPVTALPEVGSHITFQPIPENSQ